MIGILSALEEELLLIKGKAEVTETVTQAGLTFYFGTLSDQEIVLLRCGVGKVNAAVASQLLIDRFGVDAVIFTGLAGSLVPYLKRGDVVVSNYVTQHDIDLTAFGRRHGEIPDMNRQLEANPKLVRLATDAYEEIGAGEETGNQLVVGTIATGDSFVSDPERIKWLQREFGAVATEMEGGAIGQVCAMNKVPFVIIRVISDGAGDGAAGEFIMFLDQASELTCKLTTNMLKLMSADKKTQSVSA
ncbi:MAG: 5'-methylthioadenosine/adenosylhomocysteine nucleosidase [candidate division Zixibacteria bacterium]|nr:5'-methylthioadenosine/adenosylhomocysteine nucleosidase [candidate division Zixibacteria bacterium]